MVVVRGGGDPRAHPPLLFPPPATPRAAWLCQPGGKPYPPPAVHLQPLLILLLCVAACSSKLPEPDSAGARTYVHYCSVDGCHGAIPPKQAGARYWDTKLEMMLKVIAQHGSAMPSAAEVEEIRRYLHAHAMHAGG